MLKDSCFVFLSCIFSFRYIRSERSIILLNFCLSIVCSNILILVGQTQTHNVVSLTYRYSRNSLESVYRHVLLWISAFTVMVNRSAHFINCVVIKYISVANLFNSKKTFLPLQLYNLAKKKIDSIFCEIECIFILDFSKKTNKHL